MEKREPSSTVDENVSCTAAIENSMEVPQKVKKLNYHTIQQSHSLDIYLGKIIVQKDTCTLMFIAALFTIAKTIYMSIDR